MKICCIGAGPAGIACAKSLTDDGHDITVFERRNSIGGVWSYQDEGVSVNPGTVATSSRFYLGFSDFPITSAYPHFLHHSQYMNYLHRYIGHHHLEEKIRLESEVTCVRKREADGKWLVSVREQHAETEHEFDAVAVCSGLHRRIPHPKTLDGFTGKLLHSSEVKNYDLLNDKRVLVIGCGESGAEFSHIAAQRASQAVLALKRGVTVLAPYYPHALHGRYSNPCFATPADLAESRFLNMFSDKAHALLAAYETFVYAYAPENRGRHSLFHTFVTLLSVLLAPLVLLTKLLKVTVASVKSFFGYLKDAGVLDYRFWLFFLNREKPWVVPGASTMSAALSRYQEQRSRPLVTQDYSLARKYMERAHRFRASGYDWRDYRRVRSELEYYSGGWHRANFYTKADDFIYDIMEGRLKVRANVERVEGNVVQFEDGERFEADVIVSCSGYQTEFPFLEKHVDGRALFKNVFLPGVEGLAFIGFARPEIGAMPPIAELQSRWFAAVLAGRVRLPSPAEMVNTMARDNEFARRTKMVADRLTHGVRFISYMDSIAKLAGLQVPYLKLLRHPRLLFRVLFGPALPAHYWLNETGAKFQWAHHYILYYLWH